MSSLLINSITKQTFIDFDPGHGLMATSRHQFPTLTNDMTLQPMRFGKLPPINERGDEGRERMGGCSDRMH